ncbi:hypothetical protein [Kushneria phyllosphaerae]|uniref:Uncharacterized protein n=1 Tax=Kushneria phyllosphaerae TaxID=2100822 RepID=A0A2R8CHC3_9GAMM|nr:hypothetical protein [Kushneria phyllosphaerae]SPJ32263.1 hypothetical protein KSP9073_00263 [Kushneria phyllosphaerae]
MEGIYKAQSSNVTTPSTLKNKFEALNSYFLKEIYKSSNLSRKFEISSSTKNDTADTDISVLSRSYADQIIRSAKLDEYIEGERSKTEMLMDMFYKSNKDAFRDGFQKAWIEIYKLKDSELMSTFVNISSGISYEKLQDKADALIFGAYAHQSTKVNDAIIRAVESWEQKEHITILEELKPCDINWLEEYKQQVIEHLRDI